MVVLTIRCLKSISYVFNIDIKNKYIKKTITKVIDERIHNHHYQGHK